MQDLLDRPVNASTLDGLVSKFNVLSYSSGLTPHARAQEMLDVVTKLSDLRDVVSVDLRDEFKETVHKISDSFAEHIEATKEENKDKYSLVEATLANIDLKF